MHSWYLTLLNSCDVLKFEPCICLYLSFDVHLNNSLQCWLRNNQTEEQTLHLNWILKQLPFVMLSWNLLCLRFALSKLFINFVCLHNCIFDINKLCLIISASILTLAFAIGMVATLPLSVFWIFPHASRYL